MDCSNTRYGTCPCGGRYTERSVTINMTSSGRDVVLPDVPQARCPVCGSSVYLLAHLELIEAVFHARTVEPRD